MHARGVLVSFYSYLFYLYCISALDAAGPEFEDHGVFVNRDDADFVEGLHTSGGGSVLAGEFGMLLPFGHVDFYVNGGKQQPGCSAFSK